MCNNYEFFYILEKNHCLKLSCFLSIHLKPTTIFLFCKTFFFQLLCLTKENLHLNTFSVCWHAKGCFYLFRASHHCGVESETGDNNEKYVKSWRNQRHDLVQLDEGQQKKSIKGGCGRCGKNKDWMDISKTFIWSCQTRVNNFIVVYRQHGFSEHSAVKKNFLV